MTRILDRLPLMPHNEGARADILCSPSQYQEDGLKGVLGRVVLAQDASAYRQDARPMAIDQCREGRLIALPHETFQQLGVRESRKPDG